MFNRAKLLTKSFIGVFSLSAYVASCGPGEPAGSAPTEQPTSVAIADAGLASDVSEKRSPDDVSDLVDQAVQPGPQQTALAEATITDLRARFTIRVARPAEDADDAPTTGAALAAPPSESISVSPLGVGVADGFEASSSGLTPHFATSESRPARVTLARKASSSFHLEDTTSGLSVDVSLVDASPSAAEFAQGYLIYRAGHASGATLLHRATPDGTEEFLHFEKPPAESSIAYDLRLGSRVKGLRLVANALEMLDEQGAPRLRVAPPSIVGTDGAQLDATLAVDGCAYDVDPAAPWNRPVVSPGHPNCTVRVTWPHEESLVYPALLDPKWSTTGSMTVARQAHTSTTLSTGKVLVTGGTTNGTASIATAELFDPATGTWAATASMTGVRQMHTASQLGTSSNTTTSGKVLIAGGWNGSQSVSTTQLYSPTAGTWVAGGDMGTPRHNHTATVLSNGRVLAIGGMGGTTVFETATIYNPASGSGSWASTSNMPSSAKRRFHTATLLTTTNATLNNKVLVVGGNSGGTTSVATVFLFDGSSWSTLTALTPLGTAREGHTATVMSDGKLLITGGRNVSTALATAFLFDPASGTNGAWSAAGSMNVARQQHTATLLSTSVVNNGLVVVAGGTTTGTTSLATAELFNGTSTWTATTSLLAATHAHTANLLNNGVVLIAGGLSGTTTVSASELYDPSSGVACTTASQCTSGFCVNGVCCNNACTGECSACNLAGFIGTCSAKSNGTACTDDGNACTQDKCDGTNLVCQHPVGNAGAVCRASAGSCDPAETCTGSSTVCPVNVTAANGVQCNDGNACTRTDVCQTGLCVGTTVPGCASKITVEDLGVLAGAIGSTAYAINDSGVAVGSSVDSSGVYRPVRWTPGSAIQELGTAAQVTYSASANGITNAGAIVGSAYGSSSAYRYTAANGFEFLTPNGQSEYGSGINQSNSIVGSSGTQGFRHTAAKGHEFLGILPGGTQSWANAIDDQSNVVGESRVAWTPANDIWNPGHATRYIDATSHLQDLNELAPLGWELRKGAATNGDEIVGFAAHEGVTHAYRLTISTGKVVDLGTFDGGGISYALGINAAGAVVGAAYLDGTGAGNYRAAVFTEPLGVVNLDSAADPAQGWMLQQAYGVNAAGDVVGSGTHQGQTHAFRMHVPGLSPARVPRCQNNADCGSGFCSPDKVCCDSACTGSCSSCMLPGKVGTCSLRPAGARCSTADVCSGGGNVCNASGACVAGTPPVIDDGNPCTVDSCDPSIGAKHIPVAVGTSCSDGNVCNGAETCNASGACSAGTPPSFDDGNACTTDSCTAGGGILHTPVAVGSPCSDGNACNGAETCVAGGICTAGTPLAIDDGNPCTIDACATNGTISHTPATAGASCSDGNVCNGAETCTAGGTCAAGTSLNTDDGNTCTADACDPVSGVSHTIGTGSGCSGLYSATFHQSPVHGEPDDLLILAGTGLSSTDRVVYEALTDTTLPLVTPTSVPTTSTASEGVAPLVNIPNTATALDSLTVVLPAAMNSGNSYALWVVKANSQWTNGVKINDARPLWISPDIGYVSASWPGLSRQLKVIGRNLRNKPGYQTLVRLTSPAATFTLTALDDADPTTSIESYVAKVSLPTTMPAGDYSVSVQRDGTSWVDLTTQKFKVRQDPAPKPEFLVASSGGCAADDGLDDTACIVAAIAAAAASPTKGTVVFGPGRWDLLSGNVQPTPWQGITLAEGVNLAGATGSVKSTLRAGPLWNVEPGLTRGKPVFSIAGHNAITNIRFEDARPHTDPEWDGFFVIGLPSGAETLIDEVVFAGNTFADPSFAIVGYVYPFKHLFVVNNEFGARRNAIRIMDNWNATNVHFRMEDSIIFGNTFKPGPYLEVCSHAGTMAAELGAAIRFDYSSNLFDGHATDYLGSQPVPGWEEGSLFREGRDMSLVSQNTYSCTGDKGGAGDAIAFYGSDTSAFAAPKTVASATANSVTVSTADGVGILTQQHNVAVPVGSYYLNHWIQIANGRGIGQARRIASYTVDPNAQTVTFVVAPNWDVAPDTSSVLGVNRAAWQVYTVDNNIDNTGCTKANSNGIKTQGTIDLNMPAFDTVIEGNLQRASGGITVSSSYSVPFTYGGASYPPYQTLQSFIEIQGNRILDEGDYASRCSTGGIGLYCSAWTGPDSAALPASPFVANYALNVARNRVTHADAFHGGGLSMAARWVAPSGSRLYLNTLVHHNAFADLTAPPVPGTSTTSQCAAEGTTNCGDDVVRDTAINISLPVVHSTVVYKNTLTNVATAVVDQGTNTVQCIGAGDCSVGTCNGAVVDDHNPCTSDTCGPSGPVHTPLPGASCADSSICNGYETCDATGACVAGTPLIVDDGNPCTNDGCSEAIGATHTQKAEGSSCTDGNACNGAETCNATGTCMPGTSVTCAATDACHLAGTCDSATGQCSNPAAPSGTVCGDNNDCNGVDRCDGIGACVAGLPPRDDGNPCTDDVCDDAVGHPVHTPHPGISCDNLCLTGGTGTCDSVGACVGAVAVICGAPAQCNDAGTCNPATGTCVYPPAPDGTVCDDGSSCTTNDTCTGGVCGGPRSTQACTQECPCDSGGSCTADAECMDGFVCGQQNGRFFGKDPLSSSCWPPLCPSSADTLGCGYSGALCGACPPPPPRVCTSNTDCQSTNEVCGQGNGAAFGLGNVNVCWPPVCSGGQTACGSPSAPCGNCSCVTTCSAKTCNSPDKSDGCGGYCEGLCGDGQTGCSSNLDCQGASICTNGTCLPPVCLELDPSRGCPGDHSACPNCPQCQSLCASEGRECGPDPAGCAADCGTCGGARTCLDGHCVDVALPLLPPAEATAPVGALEGSFSVTDSGQAQYSISIAVPPARAGLQPDIGLVYTSDKKLGPEGIGWRLTGFSSIARCSTRAGNEGPRAVRYDGGDRFCLDGKRLVALTDGTYRTEIDEFSKIIVDSVDSHGQPIAFKAYKKAGTILTYGGTDNASIYHTGPSTPVMKRVWAVSRVEDRNGNTMRFTYETRLLGDAVGIPGGASVAHDAFEMVPQEVSYGSNDAGFEADRGVRFLYHDVGIRSLHYTSGGLATIQRQLWRIETYARNATVRHYDFDYEDRGLVFRLLHAKECAPTLGGNDVCKPSTTFEYDDIAPFDPGIVQPTSVPLGSWIGVNQDVDGDGADEWFLSGISSTTGIPVRTGVPGMTVDLNNDGREEKLLRNVKAPYEFYAQLANGGRVVYPFTPPADWQPEAAYAADLDGDGLKDILLCGVNNRGESKLGYATRRDSVRYGTVHALPSWGSCETDVPVLVDFDDDGVVNLLRVEKPGSNLWKALVFPTDPSGTPDWVPIQFSGSIPSQPSRFRTLDANGDGLVDILASSMVTAPPPIISYSKLRLWLNQGDGNFRETALGESSTVNGPNLVYDFDGDGNDDVVAEHGQIRWLPPTLNPQYFVAPPGSTPLIRFHAIDNPAEDVFNPFLADVNGDGDLDLIQVVSQDPQKSGPCRSLTRQGDQVVFGCPPEIRYGHSRRIHLLKKVVDGVGREIRIFYDGKAEATAGACVDRTDLLCPTKLPPLVSEHRFSTIAPQGTDPNPRRFFKYSYSGARAGTNGRGSYGFRSRTIEEYEGIPNQTTPGPLFSTTQRFFYNDSFVFAGLLEAEIVKSGQLTDDIAGFVRPARRVVKETRIYDKITNSKSPSDPKLPPVVFPVLVESRKMVFDAPDGGLEQIVSTEVNDFTTTNDPRVDYDDYGHSRYQHRQVFAGSDSAPLVSDTLTVHDPKPPIPANWIVGLDQGLSVTDLRGRAGSSELRVWSYLYDESTGRLLTRTRNPGGAFEQIESFRYEDPVHNLTHHTVQTGSKQRTTQYVYDDSALIFPVLVTNPLGHQQTAKFDHRHGGVLESSDPNGLTEKRAYDAFGRLTGVEGPNGRMSITLKLSNEQVPSAPPPDSRGVLRVLTQELSAAGDKIGAIKVEDFGPLGELLKRDVTGYQSQSGADRWMEETFTYDRSGRLESQTRPYLAGATNDQGEVRFRYDKLGTLMEERYPDGTSVYHAKGTRNTWLKDPDGYFTNLSQPTVFVEADTQHVATTADATAAFAKASVRAMDGDGLTIITRDAAGTFSDYDYGPFRQLHTVEAVRATEVQTVIQYYPYGRKLSHFDPDTGIETYTEYNGFDELEAMTDARGVLKKYGYDELGRMTSSLSFVSGAPEPDEVTNWEYDRAADDPSPPPDNQIGRLVRVSSGNSSEPSRHATRYRYQTGSFGLLGTVERKIATDTFTTSFEYEPDFHRLDVVQYPGASGLFAVKRKYDQRGNLIGVLDAITPTTKYWGGTSGEAPVATGAPPGYRIDNEIFGNGAVTTSTYNPFTGRLAHLGTTSTGGVGLQDIGYTYTDEGNLWVRNSPTKVETFKYDPLDRLTHIKRDNQTQAEVARYDERGRIMWKINAGTYDYNHPPGPEPAPVHAPRTVGGSTFTRTFAYDPSGNEITRTGGPEGTRTTEYNSFNLPLSITDTQPQTSITRFEYDGDQTRVIKLEEGVRQTVYAGSLYERVTDLATSEVIHKYRIYANGKAIAQLERKQGSAPQLVYLHGDHLGSTQLITRGESVASSEFRVHEQWFDPWGKPEGTSAWDSAADPRAHNVHTGFTGHEHDAEHGLINMRGRIYDPELGRFTTADPIVQSPFYSQSFNRYAYVFNNPLRYTDPSGFDVPQVGTSGPTGGDGNQSTKATIPITGPQGQPMTLEVTGTPSTGVAIPNTEAPGAGPTKTTEASKPSSEKTGSEFTNKTGKTATRSFEQIGGAEQKVAPGAGDAAARAGNATWAGSEGDGRRSGGDAPQRSGAGTAIGASVGGAVGGAAGFVLGGGAGAVAAVPTGEIAGVVTIPAGAAEGMAIGAALGMAAGALIGSEIEKVIGKIEKAFTKPTAGDDVGDVVNDKDNPLTAPDKFDPLRGKPGKLHRETGEVWERDRFHKDEWEIYKNRREYEKGRRDRTVWDDGRIKSRF